MRRIALILCVAATVFACATAKAQGDRSPATDFYLKGFNEYKKQNYENAMSYLDKAIKKDPEFASSYSLKAAIYDKLKDYGNAEKSYVQAYTADGNPKYYYFIGEMYNRVGLYDNAIPYLEKAIADYNFKGLKDDTKQNIKDNLAQAKFAKDLKAKPVPFNPLNLGSAINTNENEYFPGISIDKKYLFFTRLIGGRQEDIYRSQLNDEGNTWNDGENLGPVINSSANEGTVSPTIDGRYIFFTECNREGGVGSCDIYFSRIDNGEWSVPMVIKPPLNSRGWESQPCISADGKTLYFSSDRKPSFGGMDLWKSEFKDGAFQVPVNLGPSINTPGNEQSPFLHVDGETLYFISDYHPGMGKNDIFISRLKADTWSAPKNVGYPINTHENELGIIVDRTGSMAYYTSDRAGGFGGLDIYSFLLSRENKPKASTYIEGLVTDIVTGQKLASAIELIDLSTGKKAGEVNTKSGDGSFIIALPGEREYLFNVNNETYLFYSNNFSLKNLEDNAKPLFLDIKLSQPKAGETVVLRNIFFDVDRFDLIEQSKIELDKLVTMLKQFSSLKIEIGGHTDSDGEEKANQQLSENRAKAVTNYLISKGISANRLSFKGYGESSPIASNNSADGKAQNRRTEFKVISN